MEEHFKYVLGSASGANMRHQCKSAVCKARHIYKCTSDSTWQCGFATPCRYQPTSMGLYYIAGAKEHGSRSAKAVDQSSERKPSRQCAPTDVSTISV
jgi:hypothetical protein